MSDTPEVQKLVPGLTKGESRVLVGQLAGMAAERIGGWVILLNDKETDSIGVLSSVLTQRELPDHRKASLQVLGMILDAAQHITANLESLA